MEEKKTYKNFRETTIGRCLVETVDDFIEKGYLQNIDGMRIVKAFDEVMSDTITNNNLVSKKGKLKGEINSYRGENGNYSFILQDVSLTLDDDIQKKLNYLDLNCQEKEAKARKKKK